jgi:hypothetical protein
MSFPQTEGKGYNMVEIVGFVLLALCSAYVALWVYVFIVDPEALNSGSKR